MMADQRTMTELLRAPTEGYAEAIVVPAILAKQFELKHSLINMMTSDQFFRLEKNNPHDHIRWFNKITSTIKYKDVPNSAIKLMLFPFSLAGVARQWLEKEPPRSILTWEDLVSKFINEFFPLQEQQISPTSVVTTAMTAILKQFKATLPPASVKAVEEICFTCGGAHSYYQCLTADGNTFPKLKDNIQGYVAAAAVNYNQVNSGYRPPGLGSLPSNIIANLKGELKSITTRSGIVLDGTSVPIPPSFINLEEDERVEETLTDQDLAEYTFKKMLKALLSNKEKLLKLANTPLNENCSAVILKKLHEKLGDPRKFLIPCCFSELKCKALADLGASIKLMPLSVWKKLGLPKLISTRMTLELANRAICTPAGIARDVFVSVGKFTFPANFIIVDYESDPRILIPSTISIPLTINPLSGSTTSSSPNQLLEEFANELALTTFPPGNDSLQFDIEFDLKEIEYLLHHDPIKDIDSILEDSIDQSNLADLNDDLVDTMTEMFTDEHALYYSSPPLYDEYDDDLFKVESDTEYVYNDPFDSKGEKIKESKLLINELDLPSDFLLPSEYDSFLFEDFSKVDTLLSINNEDKVFNLGILIQENIFEFITHVALEKNEKKLDISHTSLILEDFDPPLNKFLSFKEVLSAETLLSFSSENEEKVFKPGIHTSKEVHSSLILELSHQGYKVFKINPILKSRMKIFLFSRREDIHILDVPCLHF
nr:reverse transcriptase domain-containing protein [Tanacetum cinerariifolium]